MFVQSCTFALGLASASLVGLTFAAGTAHAESSAGAAASPVSFTSATTTQSVQQVAIDNFSFSPAEITIASGTRVTWVNHDDVPHTVTSDRRTFTSAALDTDEKFSYVFSTPGTYPYYCALHPHMTAKVIVK